MDFRDGLPRSTVLCDKVLLVRVCIFVPTDAVFTDNRQQLRLSVLIFVERVARNPKVFWP